MIFAYVVDGVVAELLTDDLGPLADRFHPDFVAACMPVPQGAEVALGFIRRDGQFSPPAAAQMSLAEARRRRNTLLSMSDWTQLLDAPLTDGQRSAWRAYRQALRDLPGHPGWPGAITWPAPPA